MGLFDRIFPKRLQTISGESYWKTLSAYTPAFTSRAGGAYESELVRLSIDSRARHIGKLKIVFRGSAKRSTASLLTLRPNEITSSWYTFLYRVCTILDMQNTCFIVKTTDEYGNINGLYPLLPSRVELVTYKNEPWLRYKFNNGQTAAMPLAECGVLTKFQYEDDVFGGSQTAINSTLDLIDLNKKGISEAIKSTASYKFMAQFDNFTKTTDLSKERKRFNRENFEEEEKGGAFLLLPSTYKNVKQIDMKPYTVPKDELDLIQKNVFNYYGTNLDIIQNKATPEQLDAFFNGAIEPFSILISDVISAMIYTKRERLQGNEVIFSANRLQYMSTGVKVQMVQQLGDRGMILIDEARELFNLPPLPEGAGQRVPIRGEYHDVLTDTDEETNNNE